MNAKVLEKFGELDIINRSFIFSLGSQETFLNQSEIIEYFFGSKRPTYARIICGS